MIFYNDEKIKLTKNWSDDSIFILTDFDRTLTSGNSWGSWEIIVNNANVSKEYKKEVYDLFEYYRPIEINETLDKSIREKYMINWWNEEIKLFIKYGFDKKIIFDSLNNLNVMTFRNGIKKFLINMKDRNIPIIIISAGIGNFIEKYLKDNNCFFDNIYIISNFLKFKDDKLIGFNGNIIHSFNKNLVELPNNLKDLIKYRDKIILLGDSITDINMANSYSNNNVLSIGFLEEKIEENIEYFKNTFDIVATENTSIKEIAEKVKVLIR